MPAASVSNWCVFQSNSAWTIWLSTHVSTCAVQGKGTVWEDAQGKMGEAHEQARIAERNACIASKTLESIQELQRTSESSKSRLYEVRQALLPGEPGAPVGCMGFLQGVHHDLHGRW